MEETKKSNRGGRREGAGRPVGRKRPHTIAVRLSPLALSRLDANCDRVGQSRADYINKLFEGLPE